MVHLVIATPKANLVAGWDEGDLGTRRKGDAVKVALARRLRGQTPMTRDWIAKRVAMGSPFPRFSLSIVSFDPFVAYTLHGCGLVNTSKSVISPGNSRAVFPCHRGLDISVSEIRSPSPL